MKSSELLLMVDSVEEAIKFYTERLAFDIVDLQRNDSSHNLLSARVRKGKCYVTFRTPFVEELAEFSFIKRCANRCSGLRVEMKKGLYKYYERCKKKSVTIAVEPKALPNGRRTFSLRDPFGMTLTFIEVGDGKDIRPDKDFVGMNLDTGHKEDEVLLDEMIHHLKGYGVLRRAAKKYSKLYLKLMHKK